MLVTIGIPTYNRARLVGRAVTSVLRQTYRELDVVIVDDGSTDETTKILQELHDSRVRVVRHAVNRGVNAAKNTCLDNARGEWIGLLDSDDELVDNTVEALVATLGQIKDHGIGTMMCNSITVPGGRQAGQGVHEDGYVSYDDFLSARVHGEFWGLFSREILGGRRFDEGLRGFESLLWFELYRASKTYYVNQPFRLFYTQGMDRLSNIDNFLRSAPKILLGYTRLLEQRGGDLRSRYPKRYARYLRRKAIFEIIAGSRRQAVADTFDALRFDLNPEGLAVAAAAGLPRTAVVRLLGMRSSS